MSRSTATVRGLFLISLRGVLALMMVCTFSAKAQQNSQWNSGPQLTFQPGVISTVVAGGTASAFPTLTTPVLAGQLDLRCPSCSTTSNVDFVFDQYGNMFIENQSTILAVASGKSGLPGISNPLAGYAYLIAGTVNSTTCAGGLKTAQACGDGGPAANAIFNLINSSGRQGGLAVDAQGNIYVADAGHYVVRKIDAKTTNITTVAGSWVAGAANTGTGDGGLATAAAFYSFSTIRFDSQGNLYIIDFSRVRKVDAQTQLISTVAGGGATVMNNGLVATSVNLSSPADVAIDASGNLFIASQLSYTVVVVYNGGTVPGIPANPVQGDIYVVAGTLRSQCTVLPCGDGGLATAAKFRAPLRLMLDGAGDIYIPDNNASVLREVGLDGYINTIAGIPSYLTHQESGDGGLATQAQIYIPFDSQFGPDGTIYVSDYAPGPFAIRQITTATSAASLTAQLGQPASQLFTVANTGNQVLTLGVISFSDVSLTQGLTGTNDCASNQVLAVGAICNFNVKFTPFSTSSFGGTASIADNSSNAVNGSNVITINGLGTTAGGTTAQNISFAALPNVTYGNLPLTLNAVSDSGLPISNFRVTGPARLSGTQLVITGAGQVSVTAYQYGDATFAPATPMTRSFVVAPASLTLKATNLSKQFGQPNPVFTYTATGLVNGDTSAIFSDAPSFSTTANQTSDAGTYPILIMQGLFSAGPNYVVGTVNGTLTITGGVSQSITFPNLADVTYGAAPITLQASATSGLPISYSVSGPATVSGAVLTVTGVGSVTVTASQNGSVDYSGATPVNRTFGVSPATLTVSAVNVSRPYNTANVLTYAFNGFVNGESQSVLSGAPSLSTTATMTSAPGTYPIAIAAGTLLATNYVFTFVSGTLTINSSAQAITLPALPGVVYGTSSFIVAGTASSGLTVSYAVTGPARISGSILTITGAGTVGITATQAGNADYLAAPVVTASFAVAPAPLTVTAQNASRQLGAANPSFAWSFSGFVAGDTQSVVSGTPVLTTTATTASPIGVYPIAPAKGSLSATNYSFVFVNGTLNVTADTQTISLAPLSNVNYGVAPIALGGSSTSGLPVSYAVIGPATIVGSTLNVTGVGTITVTASQTGNSQYAAATAVTRSFLSAPAVLTVTAANLTRLAGVANPPLTYTITGFVNGESQSVLSGAPALSTTATTASSGGSYPIAVTYGSLTAANYTFQLVNGTLTVEEFSLTAAVGGSTNATVTAGATASYSLQMSGNGFTGTVNLSCSGAPIGAVCSVAPASVVLSGGTQSTAFTVSVATVAKGASLASLPEDHGSSSGGRLPAKTPISLALVVAVGVAGFRKRRKLAFSACAVLCLALLTGVVSGCASSSSSPAPTNVGTPVGTYFVTVTAASGSLSQSQVLTLTVQ